MSFGLNILALANPLQHVSDVPWRIAGKNVPWLSSQISLMILVAVLLLATLPRLARHRVPKARSQSMGLIEMIALFVRTNIARPAMGPMADRAVPLLATLFLFLFLCNVLGLVPLMSVSELLHLDGYGGTDAAGHPNFVTPIGGTPTAGLWVCAALAVTTFCMVVFGSYGSQVLRLWKGQAPDVEPALHENHTPKPAGANFWMGAAQLIQRHRYPLPIAMVLALYTWLNSFVPGIPGLVGAIMWPMLMVIELIGVVSRSFALCVRLLANMNSGHLLLAVLLGFATAARGWMIAVVSVPTGLGLVALMGMELLVAVLQAYIFTFLTALFIALAMNAEH